MEIKCFQYIKYWPRFGFKQLLTESNLLIISACACYAYERKTNFNGHQLLQSQASHQPPPASNYKTHKHELTIQVLVMTIKHVMKFDLLVKL
jgi:hypothetical protein